MAHFYGTLQGNRGEASRCGSPSSGLVTEAASWQGAVRCYVYVKGGKDWVRVSLGPWMGVGESKLLYQGPIGEYLPE